MEMRTSIHLPGQNGQSATKLPNNKGRRHTDCKGGGGLKQKKKSLLNIQSIHPWKGITQRRTQRRKCLRWEPWEGVKKRNKGLCSGVYKIQCSVGEPAEGSFPKKKNHSLMINTQPEGCRRKKDIPRCPWLAFLFCFLPHMCTWYVPSYHFSKE